MIASNKTERIIIKKMNTNASKNKKLKKLEQIDEKILRSGAKNVLKDMRKELYVSTTQQI